ncbi:lytic transglycosylase domain-containing protein [Caldicellulosiruptor naganoensis]|uniref:Lytic transglycosylase domain-containing protein n=1 Tax=Caldicellulosiruptor naganoensis TaxID=29324 RepID=A0ABY7BDU6_9FIRM|nr:lytic transglycosylase domain-containing protein [Caldicellulosiruptor naganoensis]WAM30532.1 lytic transglycosylase domain-containing protein [Caldicellulosiruptor naganoensis]
MKRKIAIIVLLLIFLLFFEQFYFLILKQLYPLRFANSIKKYSKEINVDPYLICAIIKSESNFNQFAISKKGAIGLMQLSPLTAKWVAYKLKLEYSREKLYDPDYNILIGTWYIKYLIDYYKNDTRLAVAAYNAGMTNVNKWLYQKDRSTFEVDEIPFKETNHFVRRVFKSYEIYKKLYQNEFENGSY